MSEMTEIELIDERARLQNRHRGMLQAEYGNSSLRDRTALEASQMEYSEHFSYARSKAHKTRGLGAMIFLVVLVSPILIIAAAAIIHGGSG